MTLERLVVQEIDHPTRMSWELAEKWADGIPVFSENDPNNPEWRATPVIPIDLTPHGYDLVYVKDESNRESNPTQTIKDRAAWELTALYRDFARSLFLKREAGLLDGNIHTIGVPRLSIITAGNVGRAVSNMFGKYDLPPLKVLIDLSIAPNVLEQLRKLHADVYMADLSKKPLTQEEIKVLTNNVNGMDITSVKAIEPQAIFYDWHVHEAFNENPDQIFVPYGSGRLMENYLTWQQRTARAISNGTDPRLRAPIARVIDIDILGAEPKDLDSRADKLTKAFNPFTIFNDHDISALIKYTFTGKDTGVYRVNEERILQAHDLMSRFVETEPSGSAGLALYLQRFDEGLVDPKNKSLVINTGKGV